MGRTVAYDLEVQSMIDNIFKIKTQHAGLIIGQRLAQRDIVIRLCPVPPKEDTPDKETESSSKDTTKKTSSKLKSECKIELEDKWISQYSKEVTRTLPGGFEVLGVYVAALAEFDSILHPKLRQVLFAVSDVLIKDQKRSICSEVKERILLYIATDTLKCTCRTYDTTDIKSTPSPAEWKFFPSGMKWNALKSELAVDLKFPIKSDDSSLSVKGQIDSSLTGYFKNIENSIVLINRTLREPDEMLDISADSKKSKKQSPSQEPYCIDILFDLGQNSTPVSTTTSECITMLTFKGAIQCRAFVHNKATVKEAIQAIKQDIIRSITARCEIHCEDLLVIDEESQDPVVVYELPKRVFAPLPQSQLLVCDYQFHGDNAGDSLHAFKELLNLELTEQDIQTSCEVSPATSALIQPEVLEDRLSEFGDNPPPKKSVLLPVASAAVAAMAAGLSYFLLLQDT